MQANSEILDFLPETSGGFEGFQDDSDLSDGAFSADFLSEKMNLISHSAEAARKIFAQLTLFNRGGSDGADSADAARELPLGGCPKGQEGG